MGTQPCAPTMRLPTLFAGLLACLISNVAATALTYNLAAHERACFFAETKKDNEKVAFYFAVQSGGSFDVDYQVEGPNGKVILAGENESRAQLPSKQGTSPEQTSVLEESIFKISGQLSTISRNQKYFRTRENRNFATVQSTEGRIVNFSMIQIGLIICMGALQVFVVRFFFQGARKGYV